MLAWYQTCRPRDEAGRLPGDERDNESRRFRRGKPGPLRNLACSMWPPFHERKDDHQVDDAWLSTLASLPPSCFLGGSSCELLSYTYHIVGNVSRGIVLARLAEAGAVVKVSSRVDLGVEMDTWTDGDDDGVATDKWYRLLRSSGRRHMLVPTQCLCTAMMLSSHANTDFIILDSPQQCLNSTVQTSSY